MSLRNWIKKHITGEDTYHFELSKIVTPEEVEKIERLYKQARSEYQKLYENDALTFMLVNYLKDKICTPIYFEGDPKLVERAEKWSRRIGLSFKIKHIVKDAIIQGTGWCEIVPNTNLTEIEDLAIIDPTKIDFIRDNSGNIKRDEEGKPEGFEIDINGKTRIWTKDRVYDKGSDKSIVSSRTEDLRTRICYFKLETYGDEELGLSFIKPVYRSAIIRCNIADMLGESAFRGGGIVAYFSGNPPQEVIKNLTRDLKDITAKNVFVMSDKFKLDTVPVPDIKERIAQVVYLADEQAGAFGIPLDLLLVNVKSHVTDIRARIIDMQERIKAYQDYIASQINTQILKKLKEYWGVPEGELYLSFREVSGNVRLTRTRALATLSRRGLINWDPELELHLRKEEGLPTKFVQMQLDQWIKEGRTPIPRREVDRYVDREGDSE